MEAIWPNHREACNPGLFLTKDPSTLDAVRSLVSYFRLDV